MLHFQMDDKQTNAQPKQSGPFSAQPKSISMGLKTGKDGIELSVDRMLTYSSNNITENGCTSEETVMSCGTPPEIAEGHQTPLKSKKVYQKQPAKKSKEPQFSMFALAGAVVAGVLRQELKPKTVQVNHLNLTITEEQSKSEVLSATSAGKTFKVASGTVERLHDELASPFSTASVLAGGDSLKNAGVLQENPKSGPVYVNQSNLHESQKEDECASLSSLSVTEVGKSFGIPYSIAEFNHMQEEKKSGSVHEKQSNFTKHKIESLPSPEAEITCKKSTNIAGVVHEERKPGVVHKKQTNLIHNLKELECLGSVKQDIKLETVNEHHAILTRNLKEHESASSSSTAAETASKTSSCIAVGKTEEMNLDAGREKQLNLRENERASLSCPACAVSSNTTTGALEVIKSDPVHGKQLNITKNFLKQKRSCFELNHRLNSLIKTNEVHGDMNGFKQTDSGVKFNVLFKRFEALIDKSDVIEKFKTKNGDIYMLISLERISKSVLFNASKALDSLVPVTFIVDLKSLTSDALKTTDLDKIGICNDVWLIDYVLKQLQR